MLNTVRTKGTGTHTHLFLVWQPPPEPCDAPKHIRQALRLASKRRVLEDMPRKHHAGSNSADRRTCLKILRQETLSCVEKPATTRPVVTDELERLSVG